MTWQDKNQRLKPYLTIMQSEVRYIAGVASNWRGFETGGELYGLFSHAGRPVIMLATPPGPNAIHGVAHFRQCIDFLKKINVFLRDNYGLQYIGNFHSHHDLNIKGLSHQDILSTHSIASKNGYRWMCQIVTTFESTPPVDLHNYYTDKKGPLERTTQPKPKSMGGAKGGPKFKACFSSNRKVDQIRIHSFYYNNASYGPPVQCPIRVIPGISPVRQVLSQSRKLSELIKPFDFQTMHILYDPLEPLFEQQNHESMLPFRIQNQLFKLPEGVQEDVRVFYQGDIFFLSIPLTPIKSGKLIIAYSIKAPHEVEAVYFTRNEMSNEPIDITNEALCYGLYTKLRTIYKRVEKLFDDFHSKEHPNSSIVRDSVSGHSIGDGIEINTSFAVKG